MTTNKTTTGRCCGQRVTIDGTFYCDRRVVAAYTWDGVPFNYKGKPGAAVCDEHQFALLAEQAINPADPKYKGLVLVAVLKKPRSLADLRKDPRVTDLSDERGNGDGVWAYLVAGYQSSLGTHQVTEDTVAQTCAAMADVRPCACEDCVNEMAGGDGLSMLAKDARKLQGVR